jgi:hypothetical protein
VKVKSRGRIERNYIVGERKSIVLIQGSEASIARPFDKGSVKAKTLELLEALA